MSQQQLDLVKKVRDSIGTRPHDAAPALTDYNDLGAVLGLPAYVPTPPVVTPPPPPPVVEPPPPPATTGDGLTGTYYTTTDLSGSPALVRVDPTINGSWALYVSPIPGASGWKFSVKWTGFFVPNRTGVHTFRTYNSDGAFLAVNGQVLVNSWTTGSTRQNSGNVTLTAGVPVPIEMRYFRDYYSGNVSLSVNDAAGKFDVVQAGQLRSK